MQGIVLEGGGAKGAYHIGVCKALNDLGLEIGAVAGTSVGALNGAMIVQGKLEQAFDIWYNMDPDRIIKIADSDRKELNRMEDQGERLGAKLEKLRKIITDRGLDISPLEDILKEVINEAEVRNSIIDFGIVTFDLTDRKPVELYKENIPEGKLIDYLIASASLPWFKTKTIDGNVYVDGGVYNVLPVNLVQKKGYTDIIVVRTYPPLGRVRKFDETGLNIISIGPEESLGPILDFSAERARRNLSLGCFDAKKAILKLKGRKYYIEPSSNNEDFYVKYFTNLDDKKIKSVCELFGIEYAYGKRALFEHIIPKIASILEVPSNASYEDIIIALIEDAARILEIEQFKIYTMDDLLSLIRKKHRPAGDEIVKQIPAFIRNMNIVSKIARDKIIGDIAIELLGGMGI
ncbi:MAG TPA: patatin-like phospholipase family protein [Clostridiales bacterium]|nr:patatin-like phospholipase family protein [Clostridiales bacterium]